MDDYKLKARALILSFSMLGLSFVLAKYSAKIAVNEILDVLGGGGVYSFADIKVSEYWEKVKDEIDNVQ